ncbi:MAG: UDP-N-acetylmuramate--L-alanine ligase [Bacteroidales bacterium]|nr:UDP-N-acetylmuramate--L-alanine ligase [Bacteroidales bacterium]
MNYYFLGIGGIGMSALARFFHRRGDHVEGYDRTPSPITLALESEGIAVHYDDAPDRLPQRIDLVVYTPAVPEALGEMREMRQRGVRMEKRSQVLGEITTGKCCIAVAGSHGKTTISTLIAHLMSLSPSGCSAFLGGISKNFGANLRVDTKSDMVVVEADEYDRSFLRLHPHVAVITATDPDHLDIYGTHECMMDAFWQFAGKVDGDGMLLVKQGAFRTADGHSYHDDSASAMVEVRKLASYSASDANTDYHAENVRAHDGNILFDLVTPVKVLHDLELCGTALYNVENAVAASAVALWLGLDEDLLRRGLLTFEGVCRRFDYRIREPRMVYIDDYAHHPAELRAAISSVRFLYPGKRVVGVFQPHLFSRTRDLAAQFANALDELDEAVLLPIYPAREEPLPGVSSAMIVDLMSSGHARLCTAEEALRLVPAMDPDVVLTLGAGDIDRLVAPMEQTLREQLL